MAGNKNYWYYAETHYNYHSYDEGVIFSSESGRQSRSYEDEYDWYIDACEEYGYEPECYDD